MSDSMVRGNLGHGRKVRKKSGALAEMSKFEPVDVHYYDDVNKTRTVETIHDVTAILENNKEQRLSGHDGYSPSRELRKVASIPLGAVNQLYQMGIDVMKDEDWPKVAALLDSKDYEAWRTSNGVISSKAYRTHFTLGKQQG
jgi:hypothetical protein